MFSSTVKRSVAIVGVVAGLLAAAVPASATVTCLDQDLVTVKDAFMHGDFSSVVVKAPTNAGTQVGSEGVKANNLRGEAIDIIPS